MNFKIYKNKQVFIIVAAMLFFALFIIYLRQVTFQKQIDAMGTEAVQNSAKTFKTLEQEDIKMMLTTLEVVQQNPKIKQSLKANNERQLRTECSPIFTTMRDKYGVSGWVFYKADGNLLASLGDGDPCLPEEVQNFDASKNSFSIGKELVEGKLILRVIGPYYDQGKLIGFVEFFENIASHLEEMKLLTGNEFNYILAGETQQVSSTAKGGLGENNVTKVRNIPDQGTVSKLVEKGSQVYVEGIFPIFDVQNNKIGGIVVSRDITLFIQNMKTWRNLSLGIVLGLIFLLIILVIRVQRALGESDDRYQDLFDNANDLIQCVDTHGNFLYVNKAWCDAMGYSEAEVARLNLKDVIAPTCLNSCMSCLGKVFSGQDILGAAFTFVTKDGRSIEVEGNASCRLVNGKPHSTRGIFRDVTARNMAEQALRESEARYRALFEKSPDPIWVINRTGEFIDCNNSACHYMGTSRQQILKSNAKDNIPAHLASMLKDDGAFWREGRKLESLVQINGSERLIEFTITPAQWLGESIIIAMGKDVTERRQAEKQIKYLAYHDTLTNLPNRILFQKQLEAAYNHASKHNGRLALLFLDLDDFKGVNDSLGHGAGDELLQTVAERLLVCVREQDTVARVGGDEFTIILTDIAQEEDAFKVAQRILEELSRPIQVSQQAYRITISIGIAFYPENATDCDTLLRNADQAMYASKAEGGNNFRLFVSSMQSQ